jgi:hypothetical protein
MGEIGGLYDGNKSVFINGTPLENSQGQDNFENILIDSRNGTSDQTVIPGFVDTTTSISVNQQVTQSTPVERILASDKDAARVIVGGSSLVRQDRSGDVRSVELSYKIQTWVDSAKTWVDAKTVTLNEKNSAGWSKGYRIQRDARHTGAEDWKVRVVRISPDSSPGSDLQYEFDLFFQRIIEIQEVQLAYPHRALVSTSIPAESVSSSINSIEFELAGMYVDVPANFLPEGGWYSGEWDGTWKSAITSDPAWIVRDLLINHPELASVFNAATGENDNIDYSMGISPSMIDDVSFYNASEYNSVLKIDGNKRHTCNIAITENSKPIELLSKLLAASKCSLVTVGGLITLVQDRPASVVSVVSNSSVIDGMFQYSQSEIANRLTHVTVEYRDASRGYERRIVGVEGTPAQLEKFGYNHIHLDGLGIDNEAEATRYALYMLETSQREINMCSFAVSFEKVLMTAGDIILVVDDSFMGKASQGRLAEEFGHTYAILDRDTDAEVGDTIIFTFPSGGVVSRSITAIPSARRVEFSRINGKPVEGSIWVIEGAIKGRQFRVVGVQESEPHIFNITCVQHDEDKFTVIDGGVAGEPELYTDLSSLETAAPIGVTFREVGSVIEGVAIRELVVTWVNPIQEKIKTWKAYYKVNGTTYALPDLVNNEVTIPASKDGLYEFHIVAVNWRNVSSPKTVATYSLNSSGGVLSTSVGSPTNRRRKGAGLGDSDRFKFYGPDLAVVWEYGYDAFPEPAGFLVRIDSDSNPTNSYRVTGREFIYSYAMNVSDHNGVPERDVSIFIRSIDTFGRLSSVHSGAFRNDMPAAPSLTTFAHFDRIDVFINDTTDRDIALYQVWASTTNPPAQTAGNLVFEGTDKRFSVPATAGTWYIRAKAIDTFGLESKSGTLGSVYTETSLSYDIPSEQEILDAIEEDRLEDYSLGSYDIVFSTNTAGTTLSWTVGFITRRDNRTGATSSWPVAAGSWVHTQAGRVNAYFDTDNPQLGIQFSYQWQPVSAKPVVILVRHTNGGQLIQEVHGNGRLSLDRLYTRELEAGNFQLGTGNVLELRALTIINDHLSSNVINARTVGANQIITNTANINTGVFQSLFANNITVDRGNIANTLESDNYNPVTKQGIQLDFANGIIRGTGLQIYDTNGNSIVSTAGIDFNNVFGTNKPENGATVGAYFGVNIGGQITPSTAGTYIANGAINNALIGNVIQSATTGFGGNPVWKLDKLGNVDIYGALRVYNNTTGNVILNAGGVNWQEVTGSGVPEDGATVGADWNNNLSNVPVEDIYSPSQNILPNPSFEKWDSALPDGWSPWAGTAAKNTTTSGPGKNAAYFAPRAASTNHGILSTARYTSPLPTGTVLKFSVDARYGSSGVGYPGVYVVLYADAALTQPRVKTVRVPALSEALEYHKIVFTFAPNEGEQIYGYDFYLMASWSAMPGGSSTRAAWFDNASIEYMPPMDQVTFDTMFQGNVLIDGDLYLSNASTGPQKITPGGITRYLSFEETDYIFDQTSGLAAETWHLVKNRTVASQDLGVNVRVLPKVMVDVGNVRSGASGSYIVIRWWQRFQVLVGSTWTAVYDELWSSGGHRPYVIGVGSGAGGAASTIQDYTSELRIQNKFKPGVVAPGGQYRVLLYMSYGQLGPAGTGFGADFRNIRIEFLETNR